MLRSKEKAGMRHFYFACNLAACCCFTILLTNSSATVYHTKNYPNAQAAIDLVKPGDAVVFNGSGGTDITVSRPISDVQFIGGGAKWTIQSDITDCVFYMHSAKVDQKSGKIRRTIFYSSMSSGGMVFTHVDSVSFYYNNGYLWPKWNPGNGMIPQLQFHGFMRGVLIDKPIVGLMGYSKVNGALAWNWPEAPALLVNATDPVGNGWGSYIMGAILWEQTNWMPFHIARGAGITFAHCNTEYGVWSDPIAEFDYAEDCVLLCNGVGCRSDGNNEDYKRVTLLQYPGYQEYGSTGGGATYRGGAFRIGGQRNRSVGTGAYKTWTIGEKSWLPCQHYADGITARDPFYTEWVNASGTMGMNFAEKKNWFILNKSGVDARSSTPNRYPIDGANAIAPVAMSLPDLRAVPAEFGKQPVVDMTGKSVGEIKAALDAGGSVYLGEGTYKFSSALTSGIILGAGMGKTVVEFTDPNNENTNKGFVNCTVRGGLHGLVSSGAILGKTVTRVRFENMGSALHNNGCWQNDVISDMEVVNCKNGTTHGPTHCDEPFFDDKVEFNNCTFKNIEGDAIFLSAGNNKNGQCAFLNCTFDSIGGAAIVTSGGGTYLAANITMKRVYGGSRKTAMSLASSSWGQAVSAVHIDLDNSTISLPSDNVGLTVGGFGAVSHCTVKGYAGKIAIRTKAENVIDNITADGTLDGGSYVARSTFSDFSVGKNDSKVALRSGTANQLVDGYEQPLDKTPPSEVSGIKVEKKSSDPEFPYYPEFNLISWNHAKDAESGIVFYIVYAGDKEVGRTPGVKFSQRASNPPADSLATINYFRDPVVANANYSVKAVNGANMFPDGSQATIRRWTHERGWFMTQDRREFRVHKIDATAGTVTDTIRKATINWSDSTSTPRLLNDIGLGPNFPSRIYVWAGRESATSVPIVSVRPGSGKVAADRNGLRLFATGFIVPVQSHVRAEVYDVAGHKVRTLYDQVLAPGAYGLHDFRNDLARGVYLVKISGLDSRLVRPFVVVR